ncbi:hypothetical protein [Paenibacillus sp. FSL R10-2778]|uniref:hypothetical protein n=1 Tax=Paenibacillus sp. FSL R10-2778 TaxID=2954659 RepID=UPI0031598BE9
MGQTKGIFAFDFVVYTHLAPINGIYTFVFDASTHLAPINGIYTFVFDASTHLAPINGTAAITSLISTLANRTNKSATTGPSQSKKLDAAL